MKQALEMALEFIERVNKDGWILADFEPEMYNTITAIKEALAQPQRTWVGLTEDEAFACQGRDYFETYKAIEAKLKEKNNAS